MKGDSIQSVFIDEGKPPMTRSSDRIIEHTFNPGKFAMHINVGRTDRIIRIVIGLALLGLDIFLIDGSIRWLGLVGLMPLLTGISGHCPIYRLLELNTCPVRKPD